MIGSSLPSAIRSDVDTFVFVSLTADGANELHESRTTATDVMAVIKRMISLFKLISNSK